MSAVSEVSEVSVSTTPSPFPTSSVINFSELAKEQLSCPDVLRLKVSPTLRLATVPVQDGSLLLPTQFQAQDPPTDLFHENLKNSMSGFQPTPARHNTPAADTLPEVTPAELSACPMVFIRKDGHVAPLAPLYEGPYKVLSRSPKTFQLQVGKRVEVVSVQRLKPAFTAKDEAPVEPPRQGRPRRQPPLVPHDLPRRRGRPPRTSTSSP